MASTKQNLLHKPGEQNEGNEQLTWAKVIESYDDVPEIYQEFFHTHDATGQAFPYTVLTPTYDAFGGNVSSKLICVIGHAFYVLEENETSVTKVCYPIDDVNYVEVTHRQSDLLIKIDGLTNLGLRATSAFGCSNGNDYLFTPLFQRVRLRIASLNEHAPSRHLERLDRWNDLHTTVIDMARHCLLPGETILQAILQPEIRPNMFSIQGMFRGAKCPTHTCILTDKELVLIREDPTQGRKDKCGSICNFIPLNKINSITISQENGKLLTISIRLINQEIFESLFDVSLVDEVEQFIDQTRELMPKERWYVRD